ncbi:hypothetical protein D3C87_1310250 [compost metagenome]
MALDPSIILQAGRGVTPLMSNAEIEGQQAEREMRNMQLQQSRQGMQDASEKRRIARETDPQNLSSAYYKAGLVPEAQAAQKFQTEQQKAERESLKAKLEAGIKQFEAIGQIMNGVRDQATYEMARQQVAGIVGPEAMANIPPVYDPATVERNQRQAMSVKEQMAQKWKEMEYTTPNANSLLQARTSTANNANTVDASRENAAATRDVASATRAAAGMQRDQATEMKLADDYRAQSKDFKAVGDAYAQINSTLDKATTSPAATLAAATKFMKLLDPGSVVRESELGMALQASGVFDRATNYVNTLARGKVLTPTQVADFKNITQQIYGAAQKGQQAIDADYNQKAKAYNLRPEMVTQDLGQNKSPAAPKKAVKRTGTLNGRKVVEYADGSIDYAN